MKRFNAENERVKRQFARYREEAHGNCDETVDLILASIDRFEAYNKYKSFKAFHIEQAIGFKKALTSEVHSQTGKPLSRATIQSILSHCRQFIHWLAGQAGYRRRIAFSDANYFRLAEKEARIARACASRPYPSIEQIRHVVSIMPNTTDVQKRDRSLVAFLALTAARDGAIVSLKLKHLDLTLGKVEQDAREVETKFSKSFSTWFFPVGDDIRQIVEEWVEHLRVVLLFGPTDPLFPATKIGHSQQRQFEAKGLSRKRWATANTVRKIVGDAFEQAGFARYHPHAFRNTLVQLGEQICRTPEELKAWSQNLGHEHVLTTFRSYGAVAPERQAALISGLGESLSAAGGKGQPDAKTIKWVLDHLSVTQV